MALHFSMFPRSLALTLSLTGLVLVGCGKDGSSTTPPAAGAAAAPQGAISVPPAVFAADAGFENVQTECDLQSRLPQFVNEFSPAAVPVGQLPSAGKVLQLTVIHMIAPGGGGYSGPKQLTVKGELTDGGQVIATFQARRTTMGGAFAGFKGTCSFMGRNAKAIGRDISEWLVSPTMDARLGEM